HRNHPQKSAIKRGKNCHLPPEYFHRNKYWKSPLPCTSLRLSGLKYLHIFRGNCPEKPLKFAAPRGVNSKRVNSNLNLSNIIALHRWKLALKSAHREIF